MDLLKYLDQAKITMSKFSKIVGISRATIGRFINGERLPSLIIALKIEDATKGKVTCRDLLKYYYTKEHHLQKKKR